jgi:hypothetical protein
MSELPRSPRHTSALQFLGACLSVSGQSDERLREHIAARTSVDWNEALKLAGAHLVTPALAGALEGRGLMPLLRDDEREYLEFIRSLNRERNNVLRGELIRIISALNGIGVTPLLLKGAISLALPEQYPGAADRVVGDLDIVVETGRALEAQRHIAGLGYKEASYGREWATSEERDIRHHHLAPLTHDTLPVCVEVHTRIVKDRSEDQALTASMRPSLWHSPAGGKALVPDPATRVAHNFIHSHVSHGLGARRLFNFRHLHEFASLVSQHEPSVTGSDIRAAVTARRRDALAEYWALAEAWLGAPFPPDLPRSAREGRELWLTDRVMQNAAWRRGSDMIALASGLPARVKLHLDRLRQLPGYRVEFARRLRDRISGRPDDWER